MKKTSLLSRGLTDKESYLAGFGFSIILTIIPYILVTKDVVSGDSAVYSLLAYAVLQLGVQVYFFLHLGSEKAPRWNLISMVFMMAMVLFIGVGTLWIMKNLNYNMMHMDPKTTEQKLLDDQAFPSNINKDSHSNH